MEPNVSHEDYLLVCGLAAIHRKDRAAVDRVLEQMKALKVADYAPLKAAAAAMLPP